MTDIRIGVVLNGATSGLSRRQHLRALMAIRDEGGLPVNATDRIVPDPILVGRNAEALRTLAESHGDLRWTTDLDAALASEEDSVFFDVAATGARFDVMSRAIKAGKHVYCEKPIATSYDEAVALARQADAAGVRHGTVQDKLFLPGFRKLRTVRDSGFLGRILEARLEFGRWIFDGEHRPAQRPSWNYRKRDGGGLVLDMFPHWRYMIDALVGPVTAVNCTCRTHIAQRRDESGQRYDVDVEDAAFAQLELADGVFATVNSSWCTRIRRDDIIVLQVDGTDGSAVATPHDCFTQPAANTPNPVLSVDERQPQHFYEQWLAMPDDDESVNSYRAGWHMFLKHVVADAAFPFTLWEGVKGLQLVELAYESSRERRWITVPEIG